MTSKNVSVLDSYPIPHTQLCKQFKSKRNPSNICLTAVTTLFGFPGLLGLKKTDSALSRFMDLVLRCLSFAFV